MALDEKHQKVAIEIVQRNRTKKTCNKCYDRGYIGYAADKSILPCDKCVDTAKAFEEWKNYVASDEQLKEEYKELFEEDSTEETAEEKDTAESSHSVPNTHVHTSVPKPEKKPVVTKNTTTRRSGNR